MFVLSTTSRVSSVHLGRVFLVQQICRRFHDTISRNFPSQIQTPSLPLTGLEGKRAIKTADLPKARRGRKPKTEHDVFEEYKPSSRKRLATSKTAQRASASTPALKTSKDLKQDDHLSLQTPESEMALAYQLYKLNGWEQRGRAAIGERNRMNIVSQALSKDIIERLKLSLSEYHGCDIIDVNPGVGTFSSTLHEHLKPRTHVLMEPDHELYLRWLQPMIDGDSKSYRFVPESGIIWDNLRKLDTDGILPSQTLLNPGHPDLSKPNKTLLFVANLGYHPAKAFGGFTSITSLMLHQLITAIRTHSIFQAYGQVRMLLWIPDRLKKQVLPRMVAHRKKACIETELHCHSVVEVAGSKNFVARTRRDHYIDLESAARTQERMRSVNIITPSSRQSQLEEESVDVLSGLEADQSIAKRRPYLDELAELEAALERGEFEQSELTRAKHTMVIRAVRKSLKAGNRHMADGVPEGMNPRWFRLLVLRYRYTNDMSEGDRFISMVQDFMTIQNGYHLRKGLSGKRADKARESLTEKLVAWKNDFNALKANAKNQLFMNLHDEILFRQTPSVLMWDRRPYEPLMVSKEEFFPQQEMALLDIMPKSVWPSLSGSNVSDYDYFECITSALYVVPSQSIVAGLKALAPGAADWIVPRCPSFTDIPRGGMIDLDFLSVRCLNQTMWQELFEAWMDWPFKPTKYEFMARLGTQDSKYSYATTMGEELDEMSFDEESV